MPRGKLKPAVATDETGVVLETPETPRDKFLRLAQPRVDAVLKKLKHIGNLSGKTYEFDAAEAKQIIEALESGVAQVSAQFNARLKGSRSVFTFKKR